MTISMTEATRRLGVHRVIADAMLRRGELGLARRIGFRWVVSETAVAAAAARLRVASSAPLTSSPQALTAS
jgi:hypothetical protein